MPHSHARLNLIGGRLALDFCNQRFSSNAPAWDRLIEFLRAARIISDDRSHELLVLPNFDPQPATALLHKVESLADALRGSFGAMVRKEPLDRHFIEPINSILRVTEGHDELLQRDGRWELEFVAREGGLDWLLAAIARSAAEIIAEGPSARLRLCSNSACGLFFYDTSRTHRRRWCSMARCGNRHKVAAFSRRQSLHQRDA